MSKNPTWQGGGGSNNHPLRGGKLSVLEGGMRVVSFAAGGLLPAAARGAKITALTAIADIHTTLALLGGAKAEDPRAAAAGLPPVDGLDLMPLLSGKVPRVRTGMPLALNVSQVANQTSALIEGDLKLIVGAAPFYLQTPAIWPTADYAYVWDKSNFLQCPRGCLFNITADPNEGTDLASSHPAELARMLQLLGAELGKKYEAPPGKPEMLAFIAALRKPPHVIGPFAE